MYFYHHLGRGMKKFVEREDGLPVVYTDKILIELVQNKSKQVINDNVRLLTQYVAVGLWVDEPAAAGVQLVNEVLQIAPRAVFDSARLTLKDNTANLLNDVPLRYIEKANSNGIPFYVTPRGFINLSESVLEVWNNAAITNDQDAIVIHVDYVIPVGKEMSDLINKNK